MTFPTTLTNPAQANAPTVVNANLDALKAVAVFAKKAAATSGLTWGYFGGTILVDGVLTAIADGTVALTASATNYVEATRAGVVSANTTGFTAGRAPLYTLVCGASTVTTETDSRAWVIPAGVIGRLSLSVAGAADVTLTAAQARNEILHFTGVLTGNINVIVPNGPQRWVVVNGTTGAFSLTVKTAAGTGVAVAQTKSLGVIADGTNVMATSSDATGAGTGDVVGPASSTDSDFAQFNGTTGKLIKGGISLDTDGTLAANSATRVPSQSAVKTAIDALAGLVYITETLNTASPNAANNVVSLAVTGGSAINSLALIPKGTAGLLAAVPDGTGAGGNARGLRSVDWQMARSTAAQVAAGDESVIGGGNGNEIGSTSNNAVIAGGNGNAIRTVAAPYAAIGGGSANVISGGSDYAVIAGGSSNTISSSALRNTIGGGGSNTISGSGSINTIGGGSQNTISGIGATIPGGELNTATGNYSQAGGQYAHDRGVRGAVVHASGRFATDGDAQREQYALFRQTTNATPTELTAGGAAASASNQPVLATSGGAMAFTGRVVARDSSDTAGFQIQGTIRNLSGTVALVGTPTVTALGASAGASTWAVTVAADNTNKCLQILGTGEAAKTIKWVCSIESVYAL